LYKEYWGSPAGGVPAALFLFFLIREKKRKELFSPVGGLPAVLFLFFLIREKEKKRII
jgi:hypothetical protein